MQRWQLACVFQHQSTEPTALIDSLCLATSQHGQLYHMSTTLSYSSPIVWLQHRLSLHKLMVMVLQQLRNLKLLPVLEQQLLHAVVSMLWEREAQACKCDPRVRVCHSGHVV